MTVLPSTGVVWAEPSILVPPPGRTAGLTWVRSASNRRLYGTADLDTVSAATIEIDNTPTSGPTHVPVVLPSVAVESLLNGAQDWFEKIHVYPGGTTLNPGYLQDYKILFGDILGQLDRSWDIFNAFRKNTATLNSISLSSVSPGTELPGTSTTQTVGPLTSMLASTSTYNTDLTTGLGTPVLRPVRELKDGLSRFDGPVTFGFDLQTTAFTISGSRVAMILSDYSMPFSESLSFLTDVIPGGSGAEQRIALRKQARERYNCLYELDGIERQRMAALLFEWHHQTFGLPLSHLQVRTSASSSIGATQFQITGGDDSDFRVGGLALVKTSALVFDIVEISAVTDTLISITGTAVNGYSAGTQVYPVRPCRIIGQVRTKQAKFGGLERFQITFESLDSDTGTPAGSTTAWNSNTYLTKILLDDCNIQDLFMSTEMQRNVVVLDNKTGLASASTAWAKDKRHSSKGFFASSRAAVNDLKALIRGVRGKQVSFWLPTHLDDLTLGDDLAISTTNFDIEHIDYTRFVQSRESKKTFRITFTDDTSLEREIQSSADHPTDATLERLTVDTNWPANRTVAEVSRIEFYENVRFNTDEFTIRYERDGVARMTAPVVVVFD